MWISDFSIRRPIITVTVMLALVAFGLAALANLQVDEYPDLDQPVVMVQIPYPGASPDVVEREVVEPIEEAIFGLSGIDRSLTTANAVDGFAQFVVTFEFTKNWKFTILNNENVWAKAMNRVVTDKWPVEKAVDEMIKRIQEVAG